MTTSTVKILDTSRKLIGSFLDNYSLEQLNHIPQGFSNNLIWNIGHVIVAQQSIIYRLSNLGMHVSDDLFNQYKPGTKPSGNTSQEEKEALQHLLQSLVESTKSDFAAGKFVTFQERTTATGFHLASLSDAFDFNNYHEALHLGVMMSIRKFV